jgi:uncharacterized protein YndB with AHSA1/START domain
MSRNRTLVEASPETLFDVLSDPRAYARFVVGSKKVRHFEPAFPEPGSGLHPTLGVGPLVLRDKTWVVEADPPRQLVLDAGMRPFAVNRTAFRLQPWGPVTEVEVEEYPVTGPVAKVWNPALDAVLWLRNAELLRRLKKLAERRQAQREQL